VSHLDQLALSTVSRVIGTLVVEPQPEILDLMASWDSHLPDTLRPSRVVGLGLNPTELQRNTRLTRQVVHDLNREPRLPFPDDTFDVVLNTVSVDYLTRPFEVFREVGRVLRPGGLFLVIFSNRMFMPKAVKIWKHTGQDRRIHLVEDFFHDAEVFDEPVRYVHKGHPRPADDKYAELGLPSDPIYVVHASRRGGQLRRPSLDQELGRPDRAEQAWVERRRAVVGQTLRCPYCDQPLKRWAVPQTPFTEWDNEFLHICFNDSCPYLVRGWSVMARQGNLSFSYRLTYDRERNALGTMLVRNLEQLKENIVED